MSRVSLRYYAGYSLILASRLFRSVLQKLYSVAALPETFSVIVWTPEEIDRYARADWNSRAIVQAYSRMEDWFCVTEKTLVNQYLTKDGELLNLGCGAGRETLLLARRGIRVTASDWSPRMIAEAQRRAREANLPVRLAVADMFDLPYPEHSFDYLLLTNTAYSYVFPRRRRLRFLRQAYSVLKPGGVFVISFAQADEWSGRLQRFLAPLFLKLRRYAFFNKEFEPGDHFSGTFVHIFQPDELKQEFEEAKFIMKDWLWNQGYAVLAKD